jgi:hypothetical protein
MQQLVLRFALFLSLYAAPGFYPASYLGRGSQPLTSFVFGASSMFPFLFGQFVNSRIALHSADDVGMRQAATGHSGIKAIHRGHKLSLAKPDLYFRKRLPGKFYKAGAIFYFYSFS